MQSRCEGGAMNPLHAVTAAVAVILLLMRRRWVVRGIKLQLLGGFGAGAEESAGGASSVSRRGVRLRQAYRRDPRIRLGYDDQDTDQQPRDGD